MQLQRKKNDLLRKQMGVGGAEEKNYCLAFYDIYFYFNYTTVAKPLFF